MNVAWFAVEVPDEGCECGGVGGEELEKSWRGNKREVRPGGKRAVGIMERGRREEAGRETERERVSAGGGWRGRGGLVMLRMEEVYLCGG